MLEGLEKWIGGVFGINLVHRSDILEGVETSCNLITNEILPSIDNIINAAEAIDLKSNKTVKSIANLVKIKHSDNIDLFKQFNVFFNEIISNKSGIINLLKSNLPRAIAMNEGIITYRQIAIMRFCNDLNSMVMFFLDLCYVCIYSKEKTGFSKKRLADLDDGIKTFAVLIQVYFKNISATIKKLPNVSDETRSVSESIAFNQIRLKSTGEDVRLPLHKGFIGNPIYTIGMWMVDKDIDKITALKEKKKLLENRLLELRLESNGESSEKLAKMVSYYEDQVENIEYSIQKLQN